jgi:hypothetical protein
MDKGRKTGYSLSGGGMLKRHAGWLEKMSVAALAVGLFQGQTLGFVIGITCYIGSMYLTRKLGG